MTFNSRCLCLQSFPPSHLKKKKIWCLFSPLLCRASEERGRDLLCIWQTCGGWAWGHRSSQCYLNHEVSIFLVFLWVQFSTKADFYWEQGCHPDCNYYENTRFTCGLRGSESHGIYPTLSDFGSVQYFMMDWYVPIFFSFFVQFGVA